MLALAEPEIGHGADDDLIGVDVVGVGAGIQVAFGVGTTAAEAVVVAGQDAPEQDLRRPSRPLLDRERHDLVGFGLAELALQVHPQVRQLGLRPIEIPVVLPARKRVGEKREHPMRRRLELLALLLVHGRHAVQVLFVIVVHVPVRGRLVEMAIEPRPVDPRIALRRRPVGYRCLHRQFQIGQAGDVIEAAEIRFDVGQQPVRHEAGLIAVLAVHDGLERAGALGVAGEINPLLVATACALFE